MNKSYPKGWWVETEVYRHNNSWRIGLFFDGRRVLESYRLTLDEVTDDVRRLQELVALSNPAVHARLLPSSRPEGGPEGS